MARMKAELVMEIGENGTRLFAEAYDGGGRLFESVEVAVLVPTVAAPDAEMEPDGDTGSTSEQ